jgi:hypothetical protein
MNMYVMLMLMFWDVNACLTPRGVTTASTTLRPQLEAHSSRPDFLGYMWNLTHIQFRGHYFLRPCYKDYTTPSSKLGDYIGTMHLSMHLSIEFLKTLGSILLDPGTTCLRHLLPGLGTKWAHFTFVVNVFVFFWPLHLWWSKTLRFKTYVSSQKSKWAHFSGRRNLFIFSRAPYILRTTYFSGNNVCNNYSDAALTGRRRQGLKPHYSEKDKTACHIRIYGARGLAVGV